MKINRSAIVMIGFFLIFVPQAQTQTLYNGVGHIPLSHQETWNVAGLLQDMSTTIPVEVFIITGSTGDDDTELAAAISDAKDHVDDTDGLAIIYFPEGTYYLDSPITLTQEYRNIVFQGAGSDRTTLVFRNMRNSNCIVLSGDADDWIDLERDFDKGEKRIYPASGTWATGDWIHFIVYNFDYRKDPIDEFEIVGQITRIDSTGTDGYGDYLEIKDEANMNYIDGGERPMKVRKITPIQNIGIEDLKIMRSPYEKAYGAAHPYHIKLEYAVNCWVRGVESYKPSCHHLTISRSSHCEISGCYFHEAMDYHGGGWGYGAVLYASTTNCLVENNIFRHLRHSLVAVAGSNCNVWTFNYSREQHYTGGSVTWRDLDLHAKWPFGHLFEHNLIEMIGSDGAHGANGFYNTFVRNRAYAHNTELKKMEDWSTLGNISTKNPLRSLYHFYDHPPITDRFGFFNNYSYYKTHNECYWDGDADEAELLDVSYYYSARPEFLTMNYTWPAIGPKVSSSPLTQSIPAEARFGANKKTYLSNPTPKPMSSSGTLVNSEVWYGTHSLTGNVIVPAGLTLYLEDGATINLNSYYIRCDGNGKIIEQGSIIYSPNDICVTQSSIIKGQYSNIQSDIDNAVTGQEIYLGADTYVENIDIDKNITLLHTGSGSAYIRGNTKISNTSATLKWLRLEPGSTFGTVLGIYNGTGTLHSCYIYKGPYTGWWGIWCSNSTLKLRYGSIFPGSTSSNTSIFLINAGSSSYIRDCWIKPGNGIAISGTADGYAQDCHIVTFYKDSGWDINAYFADAGTFELIDNSYGTSQEIYDPEPYNVSGDGWPPGGLAKIHQTEDSLIKSGNGILDNLLNQADKSGCLWKI